jgi:ABC-type multidrug transport system ATPase subunit
MTVYETLLLAAQFYLPTHVSDEAKGELVINIITELGLIKAKDTKIGNEKNRGVSGGERKRCNIAVQLISNPAVLFLDEPTSGLDSFQALAVMESMKQMAAHGRLVISVIHQPRSSIYEMFDKLLLLSLGQTMYMGDAREAAAYFAHLGFPPPKLFNPSDYFLDILSPDNRTPTLEQQSASQIDAFAATWSQRSVPTAHAAHHATSASMHPPTDADPSAATTSPATDTIHTYDLARLRKNFSLLAWRSFSEHLLDTVTIATKLILTCFFGALIGAMYNNSKSNQEGIQNRMGLLFIVCSE